MTALQWRRCATFAAVVFALPLAAQNDNLLANPGFEELTPDGTPESWDLFVMPMEGAVGRVSSQAYAGERSVSLFVPNPYPVDPANNWSQVIYGEFGGKTLRASVSIRTEEAGGAALWIQCFQRSPVRVLASGSSGMQYGMSGTNDWTEVTATVDAPEATSYIVVRCVLQGTGRAWFDSVQLLETTVDAGFDAQAESTDPEDGVVRELESVRAQMQSALSALQESNESLRAEVAGLQSELSSLRTDLGVSRQGSPVASVPEPTPADLERVGRDLEHALQLQSVESEHLRSEIEELSTELERMRGRVEPTPSAPAAAPVASEDFERLRSQVEASLMQRDVSDAALREAIASVRTQLQHVQGQLMELGTHLGGAPAELPPGLFDDLESVRVQMREVLDARTASESSLREEIAQLAARLSDVQAQLGTLQSRGEPEVTAPAADPFVEQFEALRVQIQTTLDEVRTANESLRNRIGGLQAELEGMREQLKGAETAGETLDTPPTRHILVPREPNGAP